MDLSYILNHLGEDRESYHGAVAPPIVQSSIFAFPSVDAMRIGFRDEFAQHMYTRGNNPTVAILRRKVAALEGAEDCLAFGSGAAAMAAGVFACVRAGDHVVCVAKPYSWTRGLLRDLLPKFGVTTTFVDGTDVDNFEQALKPETRLIVLESPNSMTFEQQDLAAVARLAKARDIRTLCDNSYATPLNQSPIALGIDLVAHSATKYLNGHSDVVAGVLCGSEVLLREVFKGPYMTFGSILSPHDAWLLIRGMRTLAVRMERVAATTAKVLEFLEVHPKIRHVYFPQARSNPQLELSERQLRGASGLLTIDLEADDVASVERFCNALKRFLMTVSWGGYESLAFPVCAVFPLDTSIRPQGALPLSLVRLSIGLEEADVLISDLRQALESMA
jgi:cystathionine beta-lyase/cystathionine gamma-synthase